MIMYPCIDFTEHPLKFTHPPEDSFLISKKLPIYAVADGVTLQIAEGKKYPSVSGAKMAADIFCRESIKYLEKKWQKLNFRKDLKNAFRAANSKIFHLNKRRKNSFSCTAALALIKNNFLFCARLCDAGIAIINKNGKIKFKSPEFWAELKRKKQKKYGILNGKKEMLKFIDFYKVKLNKGDAIIIYTDGFENYFSLKEFSTIFKQWKDKDELVRKLKFMGIKQTIKSPKLYGLERTLIAVKYV